MNAKDLNAEHLNIAFEELMMWVPRVVERIPAISVAAAAGLECEYRAAQGLANDLLERVYGNKLPEVEARALLLASFVWIDEANHSPAYSQGIYFAWHD